MDSCKKEGVRFKTCIPGNRGTGKFYIRNMTYCCPVWLDKICEKGGQMKIDRLIDPESVRDKLYEIACDMAEKYATAVSEAEPCGAFERREKNHGKQSADDN